MLAAQQSHEGANPDGTLHQEAFAPLFGDFEDMYIDFYRFISIGAIVSPPVVDKGMVYFGSMGIFTRCSNASPVS
jgi:hypothetical protein